MQEAGRPVEDVMRKFFQFLTAIAAVMVAIAESLDY